MDAREARARREPGTPFTIAGAPRTRERVYFPLVVFTKKGELGRVTVLDLLLIGVGLSMDAFAVAIAKGLGMRRVNWRHAFIIALFFGGFQALMPAVGWAVGALFASYVEAVDHWIAFVLLAFIGGKMLWDAFHEDAEGEAGEGGGGEAADVADAADAAGAAGAASGKLAKPERLDIRELLMLAIATSIDALAVGVSFAFLEVDIAPAVSLIGCTTFVISLAGVAIGNFFGSRWEKPATIVGGLVLIIIGLRILLEGLGIIG